MSNSNRQSFLDDLLERPPKLTEPAPPELPQEPVAAAEEFDEYQAFPFFRLGRRPQMMLSIRKSNGEVHKLAYAMLRYCHAMRPDEHFVLRFDIAEIEVFGSNLGQVFDYIGEHRVPEIVEADRSQRLGTAFDQCLIERITIQLTIE